MLLHFFLIRIGIFFCLDHGEWKLESMFGLLPMFTEVERTAFNDRLSLVRDLLSPPSRSKHDNLRLMTALLHNVMGALSLSAGAHSS